MFPTATPYYRSWRNLRAWSAENKTRLDNKQFGNWRRNLGEAEERKASQEMEWLSTMLGEILRRKSRIQNFQITVPVKFSVQKVLNKLDTIILSIFWALMLWFWRQLLVLDLRAIFYEVFDWTKNWFSVDRRFSTFKNLSCVRRTFNQLWSIELILC